MKKFSKAKSIGRTGVAFVQSIVSDSGSIFREVPEDTDVGIDGYIEFVEKEVVTGTIVAVQIKTGSSYIKKRNGILFFEVNLSKSDINYLYVHQLPTAIIFCENQSGMSGWFNITGHLREKPFLIKQNRVKISFPCNERPFNSQSLQGEFKKTFHDYHIEVDRSYFVELMASHEREKKILGFIGLMSQSRHRFSEITCFMLLNHLFYTDEDIRFNITDALSRYLNHPEVGFFPPENISDYVEKGISQLRPDRIVDLLKTALLDEENLMQRGSIGQSVGVIITYIPGYQEALYDIAVDSKRDSMIRISAMILANEFVMKETILKIAQNVDMFTEIDDIENGNFMSTVVDCIVDSAENLYGPNLLGENGDFLNEIDENLINDDKFALLIRESNKRYLRENIRTLYRILFDTKNPYVRFEIGRALDKVQHLEKIPSTSYMLD
ncbi:MAG TPA: DUF4365 domain-containing protein [Roseiflexaceae bacterium]|nr:DUF4365 domain-containing protein [Roseiflexaceae bacterium]